MKRIIRIATIYVLICSAVFAELTDEEIFMYQNIANSSWSFYQGELILEGEIELLDYTLRNYQLGMLDRNQLYYLRNSIYAKHGYIFNSESLNTYFSSFDWYVPNTNFDHEDLTLRDRINIEAIQYFESALRDDEYNQINSSILGFWHDSPVMSSGAGEIFEFKENNRFLWSAPETDSEKLLYNFEGEWRVVENHLILIVDAIHINIGGKVSSPDMFSMGRFMIIGGEIESTQIYPPYIVEMPICDYNLDTIAGFEKDTIKIGGDVFYR